MGQTYTINIPIVNSMTSCVVVRTKCIWAGVLISNDSSTDTAILYSINREGGIGTPRPTDTLTYSFGAGAGTETRRTALLRVSHVQLYHSHPARGSAAATGREHLAILDLSISSSTTDPVVPRGSEGGYVLARYSRIEV